MKQKIKDYIFGEQYQGDGNIGQPIGFWGANILAAGLIFGSFILFKTL